MKGRSIKIKLNDKPFSAYISQNKHNSCTAIIKEKNSLYRTKEPSPCLIGITGHDLDNILNRKSGLLGISGVSSDRRDLEKIYPSGHERAVLATDMFNYDIRKHVGSYMAAMGGVDIVLFTGGIGENDEHTRQEVCKDMEFFGIGVDYDKNWGVRKGGLDITDITADGMSVKTLVVSTNEELMIARETAELISK